MHIDIISQDGTVTIANHLGYTSEFLSEFVGATGQGSFPPPGSVFRPGSRFIFKPTPSESQYVVGVHRNRCAINNQLKLEHFIYLVYWKEGKVLCKPVDKSAEWGFSEDFGIMIYTGDKTYVTEQPQQPGDYRVVDPISLLQHLEGRIDQQELENRAEALQVPSPQTVQIDALKSQLREAQETSAAHSEEQTLRIQALEDVLDETQTELSRERVEKQGKEVDLARRKPLWEHITRHWFWRRFFEKEIYASEEKGN